MVQFLRDLLKPYKRLVWFVLVFQLGQALLSLVLPRINASIIDYGVVQRDTGYILIRGGLMVALSLAQFVCAVLGSVAGAKAALSVGRDLREKVYVRILSYSQKETGTFGAPTLITRATSDVQQIVQFLTVTLTLLVSAPCMFIGGIFMALTQSPRLSVVLLVTIPIIVGLSIAMLLRLLPTNRVKQRKIDRMNSVLRDQLTGMRVVRAFVKEKREEERFAEVNRDLSQLNLRIVRTTAIMTPLFMLIVNVSTVALLWYGGTLAQRGQVGVGQIIAFITYLTMILSATLTASMLFLMLPKAEVSTGRIQELFHCESSVRQADRPATLDEPRGAVRFEDVSFSYAPENPQVEPVLKHISFTAEPGKTTAIIGSTGCGKTTLLNLIPRLTDATSGRVCFDGADVRDLDVKSLDRAIGMVPQKAFLFSGTLGENLRFANPEATDEQLWDALRIAQAEDFVREREEGLARRVSEGGSNFSGGQRQRLSIARAIVRRPKVYLFDDSFSALDYATDRKLRAALKEITADAAVIVVAQRITSIMDADQILVMNNGEIEDIGTHAELLERCATYQEIAASQPTEEVSAQ